MENVFSPLKIVGLVLIASGLFMIYVFPKYLFKTPENSTGPESAHEKDESKQEKTKKILFISGIIDIILGLAILLGFLPFK